MEEIFNLGGISREDAEKAKENIPQELWDRDLFNQQMSSTPTPKTTTQKVQHKEFKKCPTTPESVENAKEYKKALRGERSWGVVGDTKKGEVLMGIKEAKKQVWEIYQTFIFPKHPTLTPPIKKALHNLTHYFIGSGEGDLDLDKGLLLWGGVGTSKTTILKTFEEFTKINDLPSKFHLSEMERLISIATTDPKNLPQHLKALVQQNRGFDDWGVEVNDKWGDGIMYFKNIILTRYKKRANIKTHLTTNHHITPNNIPNLNKIYGERVISRLKEMCNLVGLGSGDLRR